MTLRSYLELGGLLILGLAGFGAWERTQGRIDAANAALAAKTHADSLAARDAGAREAFAWSLFAKQQWHNDSLRAELRSATVVVRDTEFLPGEVVHDTVKAVIGATAKAIEHNALVCDSLAIADSLAAELAFRAKTACDARHAADSTVNADLTAKLRVASSTPRFSLQAGIGYDPLQGRPLARGEAQFRLLGPLSVGASLDIEPGVSRPVSPAIVALWRF